MSRKCHSYKGHMNFNKNKSLANVNMNYLTIDNQNKENHLSYKLLI